MEGHGASHLAFVASAWGVTALVLGALVLDTLARARRWRRAAERRDRSDLS